MHEIISYITQIFQSLGTPGLAINAGIESCLPGFPLPPDVLLSAMCLTAPQKALFFALICTIGSVLGGTIGYLIGMFGGRPIFNTIFKKNHDKFEAVEKLYEKHGTLAVLISAFTPIPYNIFTIASGVLELNFIKFFLASVLGRGGRFFLVGTILMYFGETVKKYFDILVLVGTLLLLALILVICLKKYYFDKKKENVDIEVKDANN